MAHGYADAKKTYTGVLGALLVLTVITVLAAGINFGSASTNVVVALVIASVKATLVALFFMHLKDEHPVNAIIFVTGLIMLAIFLIFCLVDVETRDVVRPANLAPPAGATAPLAGGEESVTSQPAPQPAPAAPTSP